MVSTTETGVRGRAVLQQNFTSKFMGHKLQVAVLVLQWYFFKKTTAKKENISPFSLAKIKYFRELS